MPAQPKRQCPVPECASRHVVSIGKYETKGHGLVVRFKCRSCKKSWNRVEKPSLVLDGMGIPTFEKIVLRTFALVCLGLTLHQVEGLTGQKPKTIHGWLVSCVRNVKAWPQISRSLVSGFRAEAVEVEALSKLVLEAAHRNRIFHGPGRRGAAAVLTRKTCRKRLSAAEHTRLKSEGWLLKRPEQSNEAAYRQFVRRYERPSLVPITTEHQAARKRFRQRVELIVGEAIVLTTVDELYLFNDDP